MDIAVIRMWFAGRRHLCFLWRVAHTSFFPEINIRNEQRRCEMPRRSLGARLYLDPTRGTWVIRDGKIFKRTGIEAGQHDLAQAALARHMRLTRPEIPPTCATNLTLPEIERRRFWVYCQRSAGSARERAKKRGLPHDIDAQLIDELLVSQKWRCAISGIEFAPPNSGSRCDPFGPSLDRIVPQLGYARGNLRIVCNIANFAMNEWGAKNLEKFIEAMGQRQAVPNGTVTRNYAKVSRPAAFQAKV